MECLGANTQSVAWSCAPSGRERYPLWGSMPCDVTLSTSRRVTSNFVTTCTCPFGVLLRTESNEALHWVMCFKRHLPFTRGRISVENHERSGRLSMSHNRKKCSRMLCVRIIRSPSVGRVMITIIATLQLCATGTVLERSDRTSRVNKMDKDHFRLWGCVLIYPFFILFPSKRKLVRG